MTGTRRKDGRFHTERGAALIVVLSVVVLAAVIVVSLTTAMRLERQSAAAYSSRAQAGLFAQEGVDNVASSIMEATKSGQKWVSMPGQIISSTNSFSLKDSLERYPLYSATSDEAGDTVNLNRLVRSEDNKTLLDGKNNESQSPMNVGWIYVRQDGTREVSQAIDKNNVQNPIVGRYAYWADDESGRINLNTAWKEIANPNSLNHPSRVSLTALPDWTSSEADAIHTSAQNFPFVSPNDARRIAPNLSSLRFSTTHKSASAATNPWGEPKIFLTTRLDRLPPEIQQLDESERWKYYFDLTTTDNADPGTFNKLDAGKVSRTLKHLCDMLKREGWPYGESSFSERYGDLNTAQIAVDLVEYVRSIESKVKFVSPLRTFYTESGNFELSGSNVGGVNNRTLIGSTRRPYISEMGIWDDGVGVAANGDSASRRYYFLKAELIVPKGTGITATDLQNMRFEFAGRFQKDDGAFTTLGNENYGMAGVTSPTNMTTVETDKYLVCSLQTRASSSYKDPIPSGKVFLRFRVGVDPYAPNEPTGTGFSWPVRDVAPSAAELPTYASSATYWIECPVNSKGSAGQTAQVSDPRLNKYRQNFEVAAANIGALNSNWLQDKDPSQDRDKNGTVTDASFVLPPAADDKSQVMSISEIGRISSGGGAQIPWRTIRLQPAPSITTGVPDWALADLFMAPYFPLNDGQISAIGAISGRINLNAEVVPFKDMITRADSLRALLKDRVASDQLEGILENIRTRVTASGETLDAMYSIGQLAEIDGIADQGEASETNLKGILDLVSVQGNVFRVYSIGQSLKQTPQGKLVVQAEDYTMTVLERDAHGSVKTILKKAISY